MSRGYFSHFLIILVVILSSIPLFKNIHNINSDWDLLQVFSYDGVARRAIIEHHRFPLRTPFFGGGYPLVANPQDSLLSPFFIISFIFGEVVGFKFNTFLHYLIGALGMYYLTRTVLKYNYFGVMFSSVTFLLGGLIYRISLTHAYTEIKYFFLPLLLAFFIKSKENKKYLFYTSFILTLIVSQASLNSVSVLLFLFLFACLETVRFEGKKIRFNKAYITNLFIIIFLTLLLGAIKIFPMLELLSQNPRSIDDYYLLKQPWSIISKLYNSLCVSYPRYSIYDRAVYKHYYLGYLPVILSMFSFLIYWKETKRYAILLIIFIMFALGPNAPFDLFKILWHIPLFRSMDRPMRYFFPLAIFIITLISGRSFLILERLKRPKVVNLLSALIIIIVTVDLLRTNGIWHEDVFPEAVPAYKKQASFFQVKNSQPNMRWGEPHGEIPILRSWELTRPTQYELMLQNIGKLNWYGNIHLGEYAIPKYYIEWNNKDSLDHENYTWHLNPNYKGEIYFLNNPNNKAEFKLFTPNKIIAKVSVFEPDILIINQNYDKYWKSDLSQPISHNGLLAINLNKKGDYPVKFNYVPISFYLGLAVSLATAVLFVCWFVRNLYKVR